MARGLALSMRFVGREGAHLSWACAWGRRNGGDGRLATGEGRSRRATATGKGRPSRFALLLRPRPLPAARRPRPSRSSSRRYVARFVRPRFVDIRYSRVFPFPLDATYAWLTDYRDDDAALTDAVVRRRLV